MIGSRSNSLAEESDGPVFDHDSAELWVCPIALLAAQ